MQNIYKRARAVAGMTQEELAERIPCSVRSLADYESGKTIPPDETVVRMMKITGCGWLCYQHLVQRSELAKQIVPEVKEKALPESVLELIDLIYDFADDRNDRRLIAIAKDGRIDERERVEFDRIVAKLTEIAKACMRVRFGGEEDAET